MHWVNSKRPLSVAAILQPTLSFYIAPCSVDLLGSVVDFGDGAGRLRIIAELQRGTMDNENW